MLNLDELKESARKNARSHRILKGGRLSSRIFPCLEEDNQLLVKAYKITNEEVKAKGSIVPAAEWLLDNFYMIEEQVKEILHNLPKNCFKDLPLLESEPYKGLPRVYAIAAEMVSDTDGRVDEETIITYINEYQSEVPLYCSELWALPLMLKIALIKKVRDIAVHIVETQQQRNEADRWAQILLNALSESTEELQKRISEHDDKVGKMTPPYAERLLQRLREQGAEAAGIVRWVDGKLALLNTSPDEIIQKEHGRQTAYQVSMGNSITSLRFLSGVKWEDTFEEISLMEKILTRDPAGIYSKMEFASREYYRRQVQKIAKSLRISELTVAEKALECAREFADKEDAGEQERHVGYYLIGKGKGDLYAKLGAPRRRMDRWNEGRITALYLGTVGLLTIAALLVFLLFVITTSSAVLPIWCLLVLGILVLIPIASLVLGTSNWVITRLFRPCHIPKLELKDGIPKELRTMVVIPTLLTSEKRVHELVEQMEVFYLANQEEHLHFALLGDFKDSPEEETQDGDKIIATAVKAIEELNQRYSHERKDIFFYFHRYKQWNPAQESWMGWERKRGALVEFNRLLMGDKNTSFSVQVGDLSILPEIKYIITLDADTQLPRDAAKRLIGAMAHPLNHPVLNEEGTRVIDGYGLMQPRIGVAVDSACRSFFALTFSGQRGIDPYTTAVSDVYQDLFCEGIFTGKGIYDLRVFHRILDQAIPENTVLSHDLLEGSYVRTGLVTDIELIDGYPSNYISYSMRLHRWVRGDWQLIPWLFHRVKNARNQVVQNPLPAIAKWKILDNMRRSLLAPNLFLLFILGIGILPGHPLLWIGLAVLTLVFPLVTDLVGSMISRYQRTYGSRRFSDIIFDAKGLMWQILLSFVFLPYQSYLMADAILRTLVRVFITKRNMLEWVTAADAEKKFKGTVKDFWSKMMPAPVIALVFFFGVAYFYPELILVASFFAPVWIASPWVAYRISLPKQKHIPDLPEEQIEKLRLIARKTWRYFEDFVGPEDHWLPPDNYQQDPPVGVAHRTSPTNIGLLLASILAARDLGYIGTKTAVDSIERTISTMEKMEKWHGHFYNWYDTRTLSPLKPLYVSSVDGGNLAGYLITLRQGLEELLKRPLVGKEMVLGFKDTLLIEKQKKEIMDHGVLNMLLFGDTVFLTEWKTLLSEFKEERGLIGKHVSNCYRELEEFAPWIDLLVKVPRFLLSDKGPFKESGNKMSQFLGKLNHSMSLAGFLENYHDILDNLSDLLVILRKSSSKDSPRYLEARQWLKQMELNLAKSHAVINQFVDRCRELIRRIDKLFWGMDFRLLYDEKKELFSIGYNVEDGSLTKSYYDLLASEARQTSFIAIAKGDVPQKHWFKLGRALTLIGDSRALLSWTGTMFEYLMPLLIMRNYDYTLLDETYTAVVKGQKQYGEQRHVPWGVSESGFYGFDLQLNYQYKAFGDPRLGLKRGLINDMVVAPYATLLALPIDPVSAIKNIETLILEGMEGPYGLYEAIDYTPERLPKKKRSMIVKSYMVHHQGMSLLALNNFLNNNIMQRRFHAVPMIKATELLLQERIPKKEIYIKEYEDLEVGDLEEVKHQDIRAKRVFNTADTLIPEVHLLSNGNYSVMLTNSGAGFSQIHGIQLSRWREDRTRDNWGMFFYIHNLNANVFWSATAQPCGVKPDAYHVEFQPDHAVYVRQDDNIETKTEVVVSPDNNAEVRRITLVNHSEYGRVLEVTSYFEVVLTSMAADVAHPAFSNLFIETEFIPEYNALLAYRRPREKNQKPLWLVHTLCLEGEGIGSVQYETDRAQFLGRGRDLCNPRALDPGQPLSNTVGAVLDPIMSLRQRVGIGPGHTAKISFITAAAESREMALALAREYQNPAVAARTFELAWTHSQVEMRYLNMLSGQVNLYHKIAAHILYLSPLRRKNSEEIRRNIKGQSALWAYGISGDNPIVLIRVSKIEHMELVKQILTAHEYWRIKGLNVDLVLLNEYGNSYEQPVQDKLRDLIAVSHARDLQDKPGGVFLRQANSIPKEDIDLLMAAARLVLAGDAGDLSSQLELPRTDEGLPEPIELAPLDEPVEEESIQADEGLHFFNGMGGFSRDGKEYVIQLTKDMHTPMPWSNIIANERFGFLVTEAGSGYTWYGNSRENKITVWSNDPVRDPSSEVVYLRDEDTGYSWTATPLPIREEQPYIIRHGQGYSVFEHLSHGIEQRQLMYVPLKDPVKINWIRLKNKTDRKRSISLTCYVEWVLGVNRAHTTPFIVTDKDANTGALLAYNGYNEEFPGRVAFLASNIQGGTMTGDRTEFIGRNGSLQLPAAQRRKELSGRLGAGYDPCGALRVKLDLLPGEEKNVLFLLGQAESIQEARQLILNYRSEEKALEALQEVRSFWDRNLGILKVNTPDQSMNLLLNRWLIYQCLVCRVWARTAFYQAGGAYGFRDQLQDVLALAFIRPDIMKEQIMRSAAHQFLEGDVQHWWHPPRRGIRTRITDDLLFLPFVTADYIEITGDKSILDEMVPFLEDEPLEPEEDARYNIPRVSEEVGSIYEHCIRAFEKSFRFGRHGLPLIGTGDWNDGMDRIGEEGQGESVWLAWFLYTALMRFIPICQMQRDEERARRYREIAQNLLKSIEKHAWDGGWYRRAYFDDGTPLGSEHNAECRIDSISQSWAVISGAANPSRTREAMRSLERYLVQREDGLIKLFSPPFHKSSLEPGYIKGYVPGVRENGGQYTHAAIWVVLAFAKMGDGDKAWELFHLINPINHGRTPIEIWKYKVEPYVIAADVYSVMPHTGRGGWTWYTGSASWMYRVGIEWILGFKLRGDRLMIDPCIPRDWKEYTIDYQYKGSSYVIKVKNPGGVNQGVQRILLDGKEIDEKEIPLADDGKIHQVEVILGTES